MQGLLETIASYVHLLFFTNKFCYETFRGKRKSDFFFSKIRLFSIENPNFFSKIRFSPLKNLNLFPKKYEIRGFVLVHILLFENIRNPVFDHFPSFPASSFMPRVTYQTELRKRIYADTRIMAYILLRRYPRMYAYCRSV